MKRRLLVLLPVLLMLGADDAAVKEEQNKLLGVWNVSRYTYNGKSNPMLAEQLKVEITIKEFNVQQGEELKRSGYTIDPGKKPKTIDLKPFGGTNEDRMLPGIYELDGNTLKVIWNDKSKGRPKDFTTAEGDGNQLLILKKQK